ncbi:partitioning protein, parA (plasmid) [Aromatoleum aromaticum EbN1]|uniref:Partitioning protein, parA n=1 Tax=Aromatoleum aromaticum (strain DSM 19018 / LMG 30748 / EbN1) TaxID=76114 RepID=Q5NW97_AROAE|nr:AAA family ATPase [Aromatoleum aromaticum]CAI10667.1 partitioning protein, parA [Aromatoleum aromaticum EbN1]
MSVEWKLSRRLSARGAILKQRRLAMALTTPESDLKLKPIEAKVGPAQLIELAGIADDMLALVRDSMLKPHPRKNPPEYTTTQLATLCGIDRARINYLIGKGDLPPGVAQGAGRGRVFTLAETRQWVQAESKIKKRPEGKRGRIVVVSNFKGGSTKTTTAMSLAQGLTLRGRKVLIVDLDPQASLSSLCGLLPSAEVDSDATVMPLIFGDQKDLRYAIQPTYWDGLDLIPGAPTLFSAEFVIPHKVAEKPGFEFWDILAPALQDLAVDYDTIVLDTPPSLSYLTINALMAADGMLMPLPPKSLDFASAAQYWSLFSDLASSFEKRNFVKEFDFVNILLSAVNAQEASASVVREWIVSTYTAKVLPVEIPFSSVIGTTATGFGTVYDVSKWEGGAKTYSRIRDAYDQVVEIIDNKIVKAWYEGA